MNSTSIRSFRLRVRDDANGYYAQHRGRVMENPADPYDKPFGSFEDAEDIRRAMINGREFEVIEVAA